MDYKMEEIYSEKSYRVRTTAIVLAAGQGTRMGSDVPKQFVKLGDREVLSYCLQVFQDSPEIDTVILVAAEAFVSFCQSDIVEKYGFTKVKQVVAGGVERYDSVYQGLLACEAYAPQLVMVHDGARPFVTERMISDSIGTAWSVGGCTVGVPVKDTIKIVDENGFSVDTPDRKTLYQIQTPQTFRYDVLRTAYETMLGEKFENDLNPEGQEEEAARKPVAGRNVMTDDTMLVEQYGGVRCKVISGAYENLKLTTPDDLLMAEKLLEISFQKN